jgi:hypothetical protein
MLDDAEDWSTRAAAKQLSEALRDVVELRSSPTAGISLVRPDGYLAYATHGRGGAAALASVRNVLERHTKSD